MAAISVIIPAHNAERTILETVQSVQNQTFSDFELIVINDGSTDQTLEVLNSIQDPRLKVFSYENGGVSIARNRGIKHATAQFISFLDADDLWTHDKLELQMKALDRCPEAGVAYSWTSFISETGEFLFAKDRMFYEGNVYPELLVSCFIASGSNVLIRKAAIESAGYFAPSLSSAADWEYWLRLAARWSFACVPKYQILYRLSHGSMSSKVEAIEDDLLKVIEQAFEEAPTELKHLKERSLATNYQYIAYLYLTYVHGADGVKSAGRRLRMAIRLYPKILLASKTQRFILWLLLMKLLPTGLAKSVVPLYGRLQKMLGLARGSAISGNG
jgi:glycosyltransferase involved in cell wall biosynthesis